MTVSEVLHRVCDVNGCERSHQAHGYCHMHYKRWRRHGNPETPGRIVANFRRDSCDVEGCPKPHAAHGYCDVHYARWKRTGSPLGRGPLPRGDLIRLRRSIGLPEDGPTPEMRAEWAAAEGVAA